MKNILILTSIFYLIFIIDQVENEERIVDNFLKHWLKRKGRGSQETLFLELRVLPVLDQASPGRICMGWL